MVILDTFIGGNSIPHYLFNVFLVLSIIAVIICVFILAENFKSVGRWMSVVISVVCFGICLTGMKLTQEEGYLIYPNGEAIEDIAEDYDIVDIDGLILTGYEKD